MKKSIFITGAASGIGRETALFFADKGWFVGITDVDAKGLTTLENEIGKDKCHLHVMDVTDPDSVQEAIDAFALKTSGRMDLLFNNAGILYFGLFEDVPLFKSHKIIDVNIKGVLNCTHCAVKYLKNTPGARIVTMASTSAIYGIPDLSVYSATKRAVLALTEALDIEMEKHGIVVCDILVPYVSTPLLEVSEQVHSIDKLGVNLTPDVVAKTVWKAAHKNKLHWKIGISTHAMSAVFSVLPGIRRMVIKRLTLSPDKK